MFHFKLVFLETEAHFQVDGVALSVPKLDAKEQKDVIFEEETAIFETLGGQADEDLEVLEGVVLFPVEVPGEDGEDGSHEEKGVPPA
jgi:hypothetical protein